MKKIWGIDIFRGIAALLVFLFHYWTFFSSSISLSFIKPIFVTGHLGVDIFFVISGFLVTLSLFRSKNFFEYIQKRIRRIVPLAWAVIIGISCIHFTNGIDILVHLFFLQGFFSQFYHSINPVMWTLSVEMIFYFFLPFLWIVISKKNILSFFCILFLLTIASFVWRTYIFFHFSHTSSFEKIFLSEQLWGRFDQFFLGIILALIFYKKNYFSPFLKKYSFIFFILGVFFVFFSFSNFYIYQSSFRKILWMQIFLHFCVGVGFFFFLIWFVSIGDFISIKIKNFLSPFIWIGKISYGIYLFHFPLLSIFKKAHISPLFSFIGSLFFTIIFSWISFKYFEKRFLKST